MTDIAQRKSRRKSSCLSREELMPRSPCSRRAENVFQHRGFPRGIRIPSSRSMSNSPSLKRRGPFSPLFIFKQPTHNKEIFYVTQGFV